MKSVITLLFILPLATPSIISLPSSILGDSENSEVSLTLNGTFILSFNATVVQSTNCRSDFIQVGRNCYQFNKNGLSWSNALQYCQNNGTILAHPLDDNENTLLTVHLMTHFKGSDSFYLGANDEVIEGQFVWSDDNSPMTYSNWSPGQPDNKDDEDCLLSTESYNWMWNDCDCGIVLPFICQEKVSDT